MSLNVMRPSGGEFGGAHRLVAETVQVVFEPIKLLTA